MVQESAQAIDKPDLQSAVAEGAHLFWLLEVAGKEQQHLRKPYYFPVRQAQWHLDCTRRCVRNLETSVVANHAGARHD